MKTQFLLLFGTFFFTFSLLAQNGKPQAPENPAPSNIDRNSITINNQRQHNLPSPEHSIFNSLRLEYPTQPMLHKPISEQALKIIKAPDNGLPIAISGTLENQSRSAGTVAKSYAFLDAVKAAIRIENPGQEFQVQSILEDQNGKKHIRMRQHFQDIPVYGGEVILHEQDGLINFFNGRYYPTPNLSLSGSLKSKTEAEESVKEDVDVWQDIPNEHISLIAHEQLKTELVIYHPESKLAAEVLCYHITAIPDLTSRWEYFVDAQTGEIIHKFSNICQIHGNLCHAKNHGPGNKLHELPTSNHEPSTLPPGPETAQAQDLFGITRTINVYETGGTYYMIDASRSMHEPNLSSFPNQPAGVVWSLNAFDTSPQNTNFTYDHITSGNNTWNNNRTAVSAHYNGGVAYEYFKTTFGRESINGNGGNIVSMINVAEDDGSDMDNAFWNGAVMFYGNGDQAFNFPLAKSLDVAGHEMSHGVIQATANLEYQYESGAMNESFADIFGAMIDRNDWQIGEDIANQAVFPSGTMRDMSNPHNGGSSSNFYWQPQHVNEMYTGNQDNGGVHINSGIINYAYYLFASDVGKSKAEQVFYKALTDYLVKSSQFVDLRIAVVQAADDLYGTAEINAAQNAFDAVGIGGGTGGDYQEDISENPGDEFILWSDENLSDILNSLTDGTFDGAFSNTDHISKPSITDDGSIILFIAENKHMVEIDVDWATGNIIDEYDIQPDPIWRNVATSKDGSKLAATTQDFDNWVFVFDFVSGTSQWFELYNPTYTEGVSTGDVIYPDVLEWDVSGEYVLYDAFNELDGVEGAIEYWDIGFLRVWDNIANDFGDGNVSKLFSGLPENVSIGNPTFSKNSPYIVAFDLVESTFFGTDYSVLGINIETGDQGNLWTGNTTWGFPSYSVDDTEVIFSAIDNNQNILAKRALESDKINGNGNAFIIIEDVAWGVWFATGERDLNVNTADLQDDFAIRIYPNPVGEVLNIEMETNTAQEIAVQLSTLSGVMIKQKKSSASKVQLSFEDLPAGTYFVKVISSEGFVVRKVVRR